jgi:hypothetical protein
MADGNTVERAGLALPSIPELANVPARIDAEDERDLRTFFENPSVATITQSSGAFGGQLERAEAFGYGALPCRRCGGRWKRIEIRQDPVTKRDVEVVIGWRDGTGRRPKKRFGERETYAAALARYRCDRREKLKIVIGTYPSPSAESGIDAGPLWDATVESFWNRGEYALMTESDFREAFPALPEDWTEHCEPCQGLGVVPRRNPTGYRREEVTAWPKGSSVMVGGSESLDASGLVAALEGGGDVHDARALIRVDALASWLATAAILRDVESLSPIAREGIERKYAPRESRASWGRLGLIELAGSASKVGELDDHLGQVWNLCAWGGAS